MTDIDIAKEIARKISENPSLYKWDKSKEDFGIMYETKVFDADITLIVYFENKPLLKIEYKNEGCIRLWGNECEFVNTISEKLSLKDMEEHKTIFSKNLLDTLNKMK